MTDENIFWLRKSDGTVEQMDKLWIREPLPNGANQNRTEIDMVWYRDENGDAHQVYPTNPNPEATTPVLNNFWDWTRGGGACETLNDSNVPPQFRSMQIELNITGLGKPIGNVVNNANATTISSEGLNSSIHFYNSFGQEDTNYSSMPWTSTSSTFDAFKDSEWGHWGSITRRIPKINTTDNCPVQWQNYYFMRPYTRTTLGYGWGSADDSVAWKKDKPLVDLTQNDWTELPALTNVPKLPSTLSYYEYLPDGLKGTEIGLNYNIEQSNIAYPCNCSITSNLAAFNWNNASSEDGNGMFSQLTKDTSSAEAFAAEDRTTTPHLYVDNSEISPSAKSGKWVVIETASWASGDDDDPCEGYSGGPGVPSENGKVCDQDSSTFRKEKEFVVAFVANYKSDGSTRYNFNYAGDSADSNFYANTAGSSNSDRWHTYDGDGYVFLFLRFVTSTLNPSHEKYREPVVREFWIQPKAFQYVNQTGTAWSNNYMGIVLDSLPTTSFTPCYEETSIPFTHYYKNAVKSLPKYYFWNIPLPTCPNVTLGANKTVVPGTSNAFYWGTHAAYTAWDNTTGRVDLLGAGNDTRDWGSSFDATPGTWQNGDGGSLIPQYKLDLYRFNKKYSSMQGFPYGVGHGFGNTFIAPHPWCDCGNASAGDTGSCPCPEYSDDNGNYFYYSQVCSYAQAQPTGGYLLDETVSWYRTNFSSTAADVSVWGVSDWTSLGWTDSWCSGEDCGCSRTSLSNCSSPTVADQMPGCNSASCWDCLANPVDFAVQQYEYCLHDWWDDNCAEAFKPGGFFRSGTWESPNNGIFYNATNNTCNCPS